MRPCHSINEQCYEKREAAWGSEDAWPIPRHGSVRRALHSSLHRLWCPVSCEVNPQTRWQHDLYIQSCEWRNTLAIICCSKHIDSHIQQQSSCCSLISHNPLVQSARNSGGTTYVPNHPMVRAVVIIWVLYCFIFITDTCYSTYPVYGSTCLHIDRQWKQRGEHNLILIHVNWY